MHRFLVIRRFHLLILLGCLLILLGCLLILVCLVSDVIVRRLLEFLDEHSTELFFNRVERPRAIDAALMRALLRSAFQAREVASRAPNIQAIAEIFSRNANEAVSVVQ